MLNYKQLNNVQNVGGGSLNSEQTQNIIGKLKEINYNLTEDKIKKATKEELIKYLKMIDEFKALLLTSSEIE